MAEFRKMRRCNQYIPQEEVEQILRSATSGVLNLTGDDGYPYGVPPSFVYLDGKIVFHCGREGHKIDAIRKNEKCSFTIIAQDKVVPEKYSTFFKSVIAFGKIHIVDEPAEMRRLVGELAEKYWPGNFPRCVCLLWKLSTSPGKNPNFLRRNDANRVLQKIL